MANIDVPGAFRRTGAIRVRPVGGVAPPGSFPVRSVASVVSFSPAMVRTKVVIEDLRFGKFQDSKYIDMLE